MEQLRYQNNIFNYFSFVRSSSSFLCLILLFLIQSINAEDIRIGSASYFGNYPIITSDSNNHIYVIWQDLRNYETHTQNSDIYFNFSSDNGNTWQVDDQKIAETNMPVLAGSSYRHRISCDKAGNVYIAWPDLMNIYFSKFSNYGRNLHINKLKINKWEFYSTEIINDDYGHVYASLGNYNSSYFNYSSDFGKTWQLNEKALSHEYFLYDPIVTCDANGYVYVVWSGIDSDKKSYIYFLNSADFGKSWVLPIKKLNSVSTIVSRASEKRISCDRNGHVYVVWEDLRYGGSEIYFNYSWDYGTSWQSKDIRINTDPPGESGHWNTQLASDSFGHVYIVWSDEREASVKGSGNSYNIYFNRSSDFGKTWEKSDLRLNTNSNPYNSKVFPQICSDDNGRVFVVWLDQARNWNVYLNVSSDYGISWQNSALQVNSVSQLCDNPQIDCDSSGNVYIVWSSNDGISFRKYLVQNFYPPIAIKVKREINRSFLIKEASLLSKITQNQNRSQVQ